MLQATEDKRKEKRRQKVGEGRWVTRGLGVLRTWGQPPPAASFLLSSPVLGASHRAGGRSPGLEEPGWRWSHDFVALLPQEQRLVEDSTREVKKVRKARNRRLEWNMMAYDKEFRPDNRFSPSPYHMASSEGSLSPDNRQVLPPTPSAHGSPLFALPVRRCGGCAAHSGVGVLSPKPVVASWVAGVPRVSPCSSGGALALG